MTHLAIDFLPGLAVNLRMDPEPTIHWSLLLLLWTIVACGLGFSAALILLQSLARPWRTSAGAPWPERARLAYGAGMPLLWLAAVLPPVFGATVMAGMEATAPRLHTGLLVFGAVWVFSFLSVLSVRFVWLRELWGARITIRSWLAGCLLLLFVGLPGVAISLLLLFTLPQGFSGLSLVAFALAIAAVAAMGLGMNLLLLRWLGIVKPASAELTKMVHGLAAQMQIEKMPKVFVLEWAMVNALAWQIYHAIGFSRPLLDIMNEDEVRAVAAHELAHLVEPAWARIVRFGMMFAFLPLVPFVKIGGLWGLVPAYIWLIFIVLGFKRFSRRFEALADAAHKQAGVAPDAYARAMIKLHRANMAPAVMPGKQTHPHLYDRLLVAGIQPDFPRPLPPSRKKPLLAVVATILVVTVVMFGSIALIGGILRAAMIEVGVPLQR